MLQLFDNIEKDLMLDATRLATGARNDWLLRDHPSLYEKHKTTVIGELSQNMIAVDTEYQTLKSPDGASKIDRETGIRKVFCVAFHCIATEDRDAMSWVVWIEPEQYYGDILDRAAERFGIDNPIFVNYAFEAEYEAFRRLGADVNRHPWIDAFLLYRLAKNVQGVPSNATPLTLVAAVKEMLDVNRDCEHKEAMRNLCIADETAGHEREIADYCLEDTRDLIPLTVKLWERLEKRYAMIDTGKAIAFTPRCKGQARKTEWEPFEEQIFGMMEAAKCFANISHRGLPVDVERCDAVRKGVAAVKDRLVRAFVEKYPGAFTLRKESTKTLDKFANAEQVSELCKLPLSDALDKLREMITSTAPRTIATVQKQFTAQYELTSVKGIEGLWKRDDKVCRKYLADHLRAIGLLDDWARTPKGELSMTQGDLADAFKLSDHVYMDGFGGDYAALASKINTYNGVMKEGEDNWFATLDREDARLRYRSLRPFTSKTGRCQPQTSRGFVPGWDKSLHCVLNPPKGRWLVELDFSAEETFIQAQVFGDERYHEIYCAKDTYLWMGAQLGLIPRDDYETMTVKELKAKYGETRKRLKTFTLALGYGAGVQKLSSKVGLPVDEIRELCDRVKTDVFPRTTNVRSFLEDRIMSNAPDRTRVFWLQGGWHTVMPPETDGMSPNAPLNFPIQGTGSTILHRLVVELERLCIESVATVHDAVWFLVDEGDVDTIALARATMERVANETLGVKPGEKGIRIGEPEIIKHGDLWTPEHDFDEQAIEVLEAGGYHVET